MLSCVEKEEIKKRIDELFKIIPDLDKKYKLNSSKIFAVFFGIIKEKNENKEEDEIFSETEEKFKTLKIIFRKNWISILDDIIIKDFFKALKFMKNNEIVDEIKFMKDYFELNDINKSNLAELLEEIKKFQEELKNNIIQKDSNLNKELLNLKLVINNKNQIIKQQKETILGLQAQLNSINNLNNNNQLVIQNLQSTINIREQELKSLKNKLKYKNEEIDSLKLNNKIISMKGDEISFAIKFMSVNQDMDYPIMCKTSDSVARIEEQVYNEFPKYKDYITYLTVNGREIKRFKTIEENEIHKGNTIMVNIYDFDNI